MTDSHLGSMLRIARKDKGWSLRDAERETGVPNAHILQIETGKICRPHMLTLGQLALGYDIPLRELMEAGGYLDARARGLEERTRASERQRIAGHLRDLCQEVPTDVPHGWRMLAFLHRHGLQAGAGAGRVVAAAADEIEQMGESDG
jgi:transcriptional regulator with XRE-family HTH domain